MAISVYGIVSCDVNQTPSLKAKSKFRHGRVRVSYDELEASAIPVGKQIAMGWVPSGATLISCRLKTDALGTGTYLCVGDIYDCDRFISNVSTVTAQDTGLSAAPAGAAGGTGGGCDIYMVIGAVNIQDSSMGNEHQGMGYTFQCDTDIVVTVPYAGGAITGTVKLAVTYSTD